MARIICRDCGTEMHLHEGEETCVGYYSPTGHDHNDNCLTSTYSCPKCKHYVGIHVLRRCPACDWVGKKTCFCHEGEKVDVSDKNPAEIRI